jgi:hypothetical protein
MLFIASHGKLVFREHYSSLAAARDLEHGLLPKILLELNVVVLFAVETMNGALSYD